MAMKIITGTPNNLPAPKKVKPFENPEIILPSIHKTVRPLKSSQVPKVATKGGSFILVTITPLINPRTAPRAKPIGIATKTATTGQMCPILTNGRVKVTAGGAVTRGKAVCSAADGKIIQLVDQAVDEGGAAKYTIFYNRKLGTALESATADNDLIFIKVVH